MAGAPLWVSESIKTPQLLVLLQLAYKVLCATVPKHLATLTFGFEFTLGQLIKERKRKPTVPALRTAFVVTILGLVPGVAVADMVRYESEIHTGNNILAFYNHSSSQSRIVKITVTLGPGAVFDTGDPSFTFGSTSLSRTITVGHFTPTWTANETSSDVGLVGPLLSAFSADGHTATFNFTDFMPGENWGVFVDIDPTGGTGDAAGAAMNGLLVSVVWASGIVTTSSCTDPYYTSGVDECHPATFSGNKKSFPSANGAEYAGVPEPMSIVLFGSGLITLVWLRQRRRTSRVAPRNSRLARIRLAHEQPRIVW